MSAFRAVPRSPHPRASRTPRSGIWVEAGHRPEQQEGPQEEGLHLHQNRLFLHQDMVPFPWLPSQPRRRSSLHWC
jgi:hypothetical protein